ncbi:MAG: hypothetical protein FWF85_06390 [Clostridiales bacterium]|nr:hypothetical protein [Clostridiales bacterium]
MKKIVVATIVLAMLVIAFSITAFATAPGGLVEKITEVEYKNYPFSKESANNKTVMNVGGVTGINLVCSNNDGWYLDVTDPELKGDIEVAYKIGSQYYIVVFKISGGGKYYIGDGKGANGINHAKVGEFVPCVHHYFH